MAKNTTYWIKEGASNELGFLIAVRPDQTVLYSFYRMWKGPKIFSKSRLIGKPKWNAKGFVKVDREMAKAVEEAPNFQFC